jgi:ribosomal protein L11 methyltransferase
VLWCEVRLSVPLASVEPAADALRAVAPTGVAIEEPVVPLGAEEGVWLDRRRPALVCCYLLVDDGLGARLDEIDRRLTASGIRTSIETRRLDEREWAEAWKEHFQVERVGRRLVIRPSWRAYEPEAGDVVIDLDPGMAFGTGQHETTRGCLVLLERLARPGMGVLDVGTGSGILAVAAAKLGAASVLACDIEPQSIAVARENAERNGVADRVLVEQGSLGPRWPFPQAPVSCADLVLANIHARALIELAEPLATALAIGGAAILSGIIADREGDVLAAFARQGLEMADRLSDGDWRTLAVRWRETPR